MDRNYAQSFTVNWAVIGLLAVSIVWGTSYGTSKQVLQTLSVPQLLFARFALSCAVLVVILYKKKLFIEFTNNAIGYLKVGLLTGAILSSIFITETWAVMLAQAGQVAVLISLCILFTPFLEKVWLKVSLPKGLVGYCFIGVVGVALLSNVTQQDFTFNLGVALVLIAAVLRAIMVVTCRKAFTGHELNTELITFIQLSVVTVVSLLLMFKEGSATQFTTTMMQLDWVTSSCLIYLALGCTLMAFFLQNYAVKFLHASQASLLMGTEPLFGLIFAAIFLQEQLTNLQWLGSFLIISTTVAACYQFSKHKQP
ncbi:DMT family transporter [Vibrio mediterranei]|jgi:drug/metabolite transporter (DMT)-like permease|uniref:DMT family transporter n=1 Tax=Vibrio mediterranei TaxID=689 RepID=A0A3G4V6R4_9VIBR|nr:DMT family transporter [Vibrio mediterranei]AYV20185.1 DMT family transporter [Vibrio mediterranei]NUW72838.1 DMT family transporter [Vibrio mediterranei]